MSRDYVHLSRRSPKRKRLLEKNTSARGWGLLIAIIIIFIITLITYYPKWYGKWQGYMKQMTPSPVKVLHDEFIRFDFYDAKIPPKESEPCFLQLGTYPALASAKLYQAELAQQGFQAVITQISHQGKKDYRVQLKDFKDEKACQSMQAILETKQISSVIIRG